MFKMYNFLKIHISEKLNNHSHVMSLSVITRTATAHVMAKGSHNEPDMVEISPG